MSDDVHRIINRARAIEIATMIVEEMEARHAPMVTATRIVDDILRGATIVVEPEFYQSTNDQLLPGLRSIAEKMMANIDLYPASPYTKDTVANLDQVMKIIERWELNGEPAPPEPETVP